MFEAVCVVLLVIGICLLAWAFNFAQIWVTWIIAKGMFCTSVQDPSLMLILWISFWVTIIDTCCRIMAKAVESK